MVRLAHYGRVIGKYIYYYALVLSGAYYCQRNKRVAEATRRWTVQFMLSNPAVQVVGYTQNGCPVFEDGVTKQRFVARDHDNAKKRLRYLRLEWIPEEERMGDNG